MICVSPLVYLRSINYYYNYYYYYYVLESLIHKAICDVARAYVFLTDYSYFQFITIYLNGPTHPYIGLGHKIVCQLYIYYIILNLWYGRIAS